MATIEKRLKLDGKTPAWRVRIRKQGHSISHTFSTKTLALRWSRKTELEIEEGCYFGSEQFRPASDLIERFLKSYLPKLGASTQAHGRVYLTWWSKRIGDIQIGRRDALRFRVQGALEELAQDRSSATVNRYRSAMARVFSLAISQWHWSEVNPFAGIPKEREPQVRVRYLLDDERSALLDACRTSSSPWLYPFVLIALRTGARQGSIAKLEWRGDVQLDRRLLVFRKTKNREPLGAHIPTDLLEALQDWGSVRRIDSPLVFPKGWRVWAWGEARARAAERVPSLTNFRFHDLRHTSASYLAMRGTDSQRIKELLGHRTLEMVQKYAHLAPGHSDDIIDRISEERPA